MTIKDLMNKHKGLLGFTIICLIIMPIMLLLVEDPRPDLLKSLIVIISGCFALYTAGLYFATLTPSTAVSGIVLPAGLFLISQKYTGLASLLTSDSPILQKIMLFFFLLGALFFGSLALYSQLKEDLKTKKTRIH